VDDVDLLAVQFAHHRADPGTHRSDAGALRVDSGHRRPYGDLGTVTRLPGDRLDLDRSVGDLRYLQREQALDQVGVRTRQRDLRTAEALGHVGHHALDALAVLVHLARYLLRRREHRLDL